VASKDVNESAREALSRSIADSTRVYRSEREEKDDYYFFCGEQLIFYKSKVRVIDGKATTVSPLTNLWDDLLSNNLHAEGGVSFPNGKKPEGLIKRCLELATQEGDIVLDSFAGSGTTGAVAHKMKRQWIMVERDGSTVSDSAVSGISA
jgi:adenine-specific DNA-methyltransferase